MNNKKIIFNLHNIFYKLGAYNRDPQEHANNVIESNSLLAKECLELMGVEIKPLDQLKEE